MDSSIVKEAYQRLFPDSNADYNFSLDFSGRFSDYNANVRMIRSNVCFGLSKKWRGVNHEIMIGLFQSLFLKIFKKKGNTLNIDLYNNFIKSLHHVVPKNLTDPLLETSFTRVNEKYFNSLIEVPNLKFGRFSSRKLGSYNFQQDTITLSLALKEQPSELIDYVMYHEMLHKLHKFRSTNGRNLFHSKQFRLDEKAFENSVEIEKKLRYVGRKPRTPKVSFFDFFR